jgi:hypothetical protein
MDPGFQDWLRLWPYAVLRIVVASWGSDTDVQALLASRDGGRSWAPLGK